MKITQESVRALMREVLVCISLRPHSLYEREQIIEEAMDNKDAVNRTREYLFNFIKEKTIEGVTKMDDELVDFLKPILTKISENI